MHSSWVASLYFNILLSPPNVSFIIICSPPDVVLYPIIFAFGRYASFYLSASGHFPFIKFTSDPDVMLDCILSPSVVMLKDRCFRLQTLCFVILFLHTDVTYASLYYLRLRKLCFIILFPVRTWCFIIYSASGRSASSYLFRLRTFCFIILFASGRYARWMFRIFYDYMMRASGRYPLSSDVLLMSFSFIIWCSLQAAIASGRYHLSYDVCLRTVTFIIWCFPPTAIIYYVMFACGRYHLLCDVCFRALSFLVLDVRVRALSFIMLCASGRGYLPYSKMRASGRYPLLPDARFLPLSLIIWCSLPAATICHLMFASGRYLWFYDAYLRMLSFIMMFACGRCHLSYDVCLQMVAFIIWCSPSDAVVYYLMFASSRYPLLQNLCLRTISLIMLCASGRYYSWHNAYMGSLHEGYLLLSTQSNIHIQIVFDICMIM